MRGTTGRTAGTRTSRAARTAAGALAVTAALCAVAALPGVAAADSADSADPGGSGDVGDVRAYRTAEDAETVDGAASSADGPRLRHGRTYTDTIEPGQEKYYTVALEATPQPRIAVTALPAPGSEVASSDGISITLESTDGTSCADGDADFDADGAARPVTAWVSRLTEPDGACQDAGVYNLSVTRESDPASDPAAWPLELHLMREPGLQNVTSTKPPKTDDLPTEPPQLPTGTPDELTGGTGFNDAAGMGEGVWKDRLRPGETRFYRVPVDWGQALALSAEFGTAKTKGGDDAAYTSGGVRVEVYNPARGHVDGVRELYRADSPAAATLRTPRVAYRHRYAYDSSVQATSVAGWYYVAVHAHPDLGRFVDGTVPVTLRTELVGDPGDGPDYAGDAVAAGFGVSEDDREQAARGLTPQAAERSDVLTVVGWGGVGTGTALVAGLGLWALLARRGAAAGTPAEVPTPGSGPGPYGQPPHGSSYGPSPTPPAPPGYGPPPGRR